MKATIQLTGLWALLHAGRLRELAELAVTTLRDAQRRGDLHLETSCYRVASVTSLVADRPDLARVELARVTWAVPPAGVYLVEQWFELEATLQIFLYEISGREAGPAPDAVAAFRRGLAECEASLLGRIEVIASLRNWLEARLLLVLATTAPGGASHRRRVRTCARRLRRVPTPFGAVWGRLIEATLAHQEGRRDDAVARLREVLTLSEGNMVGCAAIARYRLGALVGGEEGRALLDAAQAWATAEGVVNLARFADVMAPGFG